MMKIYLLLGLVFIGVGVSAGVGANVIHGLDAVADADEDVDDGCEVISNHTISGVEYRQCKDGK